jgi:hypothetical protein
MSDCGCNDGPSVTTGTVGVYNLDHMRITGESHLHFRDFPVTEPAGSYARATRNIALMNNSSKSCCLNSTHIFGTRVPVEEPSTASKS